MAGPYSVFPGLRGPTFTSNPKTDRGIKRMVGERAGKEGRKERVSESIKEIMRKRVIKFRPFAPQG